ncbi:Eukaryotic translation initiation factor 2 subunit alpha-like protein [Thalictrum thalictroides]|uniref:Eukaryotic translation initiation factor 2 subunit alpha-like protein n=1 Tax=Thalictrum thalictroides TaxID=46969 RepID=A0A7J6WTA7_THATH|nr:Eukaryotic translation initiation factor 2 subunit alpha-like protein [Thalictrum thalictroides]
MATNTPNLECRMYEAKYPEVDMVVMIVVKTIEDVGAYVTLPEFNNIEGSLYTCWVAPLPEIWACFRGRIRNLSLIFLSIFRFCSSVTYSPSFISFFPFCLYCLTGFQIDCG